MKEKKILVPLILTILLWVIFFLPAGSLHFWEAWMVWGGFTLITLGITLYFSKKAPEFLERRSTVQKKDKTNQSPAIFKLFYLGFILPGLDYRFHWSVVPLWLIFTSAVLALLGYLFIFIVFRENMFASAVIRVEREQKVIESGPYALVRHPMYTGMIVISLFLPLALGSYVAIVPMLLIVPMLVLRIQKEEALLKDELKGYDAYCKKVRYRLLPLVW
ncbi:methyltransferase family protein [Acetobacterium sp. UBA5834]|jgi:protein-S-isoprenylcysteine O-methyltransferase Ste14|uniref:methyltransferase family protein n=1 Tax=Acetobacterium sp. UBA5834 TaxID=1945907 RepID=UPI00257E9363|nr:isoprenylcysteine carboxylmethyltransferase family protein [Acetobacterium sp. UBA5834]